MMFGWKTSIAMAAACAIGVVGGVTYAKATRPEYVMVAAGASKFSSLDPANPGSPQIAVLSGDIKTGPVAIELKLAKGGPGLHWHTSDYYAMTLEGNTKHWLPGKEAEARSNPPGTFWFQPGGATGTHGDECLSDSCRVFLYFPGKFDFTPAAAPVKK